MPVFHALNRPVYFLLAAVAAITTVAVIVVGLTLGSMREQAREAAWRNLDNFTRTIALGVDRGLRVVDLLAIELRDRFETYDVAEADAFAKIARNASNRRYLIERLNRLPAMRRITVHDAQGRRILDTDGDLSGPPADDSRETYVRKALDTPGREMGMTMGREGLLKQTVARLTTRIEGADGRLFGVITVTVNVLPLRALLAQQRALNGVNALLADLDGSVIISRNFTGEGEVVPAIREAAQALPLGGEANIVLDDGSLMAVRRLSVFRLVSVSKISHADVFADWQRLAMILSAVILVMVAATIVLLRKMSRMFGAITASERAAIAANAKVFAASRQLYQAKDHLDLAISHMRQGLVMFDADQRITLCNRAYADLYGIPFVRLVPGTSLEQVLRWRVESGVYPQEDAESYIGHYVRDVWGQPQSSTRKMRDGRTFFIHTWPMDNGGMVSTHEDVTDLVEAKEKLARMAQSDHLTGLANRARFMERMEVLCTEGPQRFTLVLIDLDHFKTINDTLGHAAGDALLKTFAERLEALVAPFGLAARLGGDEFAALLDHLPLDADLEALMAKLVDAASEPISYRGYRIQGGASVGYAAFPSDASNGDDLFVCADLALYRAKSEGRGRAAAFLPQMDADMRRRRLIEGDLPQAIERGEITLHYQPIVDARTRATNSVEALARWTHPTLGPISPMTFITIAEETGYIVELGAWILRKACEDAAQWPSHVGLSVNLSAAQLCEPRFEARVLEAIDSAGLDPHRLSLEITETVFLKNDQENMRSLHALKERGIHIVLDDFGTGYSALSYLQRFPFDRLKIDRSFVDDLPARTDSVAIVTAIISLARTLGIRTVAEGIETESQSEMLRLIGCDCLQGYLFSKPVPVEELRFDHYRDGGYGLATTARRA